jgi:hypothetical protein
MRRFLTGTAGIVLVLAGVAGLVLAVAGLIALARVEARVESATLEQIEIVERALQATSDGLELADQSLSGATATVASLQTTLSQVGRSVDDTVPIVEDGTNMVVILLPRTLSSTQRALLSASDAARQVERFLAIATAIPLLAAEPYDPEVPMYEGLEDAAADLGRIGHALEAMEPGLAKTSDNLSALGSEFEAMSESIEQVSSSLEDTRSILMQYQGVAADLLDVAERVHAGLPEWLRVLRLGLSLVLIWLGIAQIALITQGWELLGRSRTGT